MPDLGKDDPVAHGDQLCGISADRKIHIPAVQTGFEQQIQNLGHGLAEGLILQLQDLFGIHMGHLVGNKETAFLSPVPAKGAVCCGEVGLVPCGHIQHLRITPKGLFQKMSWRFCSFRPRSSRRWASLG